MYIFQGKGCNGKSIMIDFINKTYGDYVANPAITLLTRKRNSSANASPDIYGLKGVRFLIIQEPEKDDEIHTSMMKQMFGHDYIEARQLYSGDYIKFKLQALGILICNDLPKINTQDDGTWRRLLTVPHEITFKDNPQGPNERLIEPNLSQELDHLIDQFNSILIHYYKKYIHNKKTIHIPKKASDFKIKFKIDSDTYYDFFTTFIEEEYDGVAKIDDVYNVFKMWYKETRPGNKPPPRKDLQARMENKYGHMFNKNSWKGISLNYTEETLGSLMKKSVNAELDL